MATNKSMYVIRNGRMIELRQYRFKLALAAGKEHPHDLCALAPDVTTMRSMVDIPGRWHGEVDWSAIEREGYRWRVTPAGTRIYVNPEGTDIGHVYETPAGMWRGEPWGRTIDCFPTVGAAMAHVEREMAK